MMKFQWELTRVSFEMRFCRPIKYLWVAQSSWLDKLAGLLRRYREGIA